MPIDPGTTTPIFLGSLVANGMTGPSVSQLASAMALGLFQYLQSGVVVLSIDTGTLGAGTGICPTIFLDEQVLLAAMTTSLSAHGVVGPFQPALANGVSLGIALALALAFTQTINPTVGVGAGKLQLVPNGQGQIIFPAAFTASGAVGPMSALTASAIGLGLDAVIVSALGIVAIVGPPSIIPSAGVGTGKIS
jgi:hypothetical protein